MPRIIEISIDISAPVEGVWGVLTDFSSYPEWSRFIASIEGKPSAGAKLSVRLDDGGGAMQFRPEVLICKPYELRWRGVLGAPFLFSGEHSFRLQSLSRWRNAPYPRRGVSWPARAAAVEAARHAHAAWLPGVQRRPSRALREHSAVEASRSLPHANAGRVGRRD